MTTAAGNRQRSVLVSGGTTGIGFATAARFISGGARVLITGNNETRLAEAARTLGPDCFYVDANNGDIRQTRRVSEAIEHHLGQLDVLVANAGVCLASNIEALDEAKFDQEFNVNFKGTIFLIAACLPLMTRGSVILATTSVNDVKGIVGQLVYSATKAALRSAVRTLAAELAPRGIRVNGVAPGPIDTPIFEKASSDPAQVAEWKETEANITTLKRLGTPGEIAAVFEFLASEQASYITGADIRADGGWADI
ncbi:SDR family oxidoreductase [Rhizobium laguerreae]|uniref:SDR family oxidoreductase n=1 Tax=Rhizobium laguerreae TaxID=1076926 RepID=UPI001C8FCC44|nr:SDR family oxidoreductase [Rhizobium laguerreae]MBY3381823.1 SDR family oxidoreductase [Rhizobium laguerreae]